MLIGSQLPQAAWADIRAGDMVMTLHEIESPRTDTGDLAIGFNQVKRMHSRKVRTLIGHQQVDVGLKCLPSLLRFSAEPMTPVLHDDGTLDSEDCARLVAALPGALIVRRNEADSRVEPLLARYPKCREYRRQHPLALKLLDMPLLEPNDLAYCDSDVLFLKPFTQLFQWSSAGASAIFMQDIQHAYSLRPWHIYPLGKIRVPSRVNTGLIFFRAADFDPEFIEWLLGQKQLEEVFNKRAHWIEQTCWAALGWRVGCYVWSRRQFVIANPRMLGLTDATVGIHFVAASRGKLDEFPINGDCPENYEKAVPINASPVQSCSAGLLLVQDIMNRF